MQLELSEIQAYLLHDYIDMRCSKYYLTQVTNGSNAKKFISDISGAVTHVNVIMQ